MLTDYDVAIIASAIISASLALLTFHAYSRRWQVRLRTVVACFAFLGLVFAWARQPLSRHPIEDGPTAFGLGGVCVWVFIIVWIVMSGLFSQFRTSDRQAPAGIPRTRRRWYLKRVQGRTFGWMWVAILYSVFHDTWARYLWIMAPTPGTLWAATTDLGFSLRAMNHAVHFMVLLYVFVNLWRESIEPPDYARTPTILSVLIVVLLIARQITIFWL